MAVVEKRKNVWSALLINHLMFMIICLFVMLPAMASNGILKVIIGSVLCFMYYFGIHDYCHKAGREHSQPFTEEKPSWKYPLYYGAAGCVFFWIPVVVLLFIGRLVPGESLATLLLRLLYLVWDSPFIFIDVFTSTDYNALNLWPPVIFTLLFFVASFSGYWFGQKGKSLVGIVNGKLSAAKPKKKEQDEIKK